jgi:hypothetical protein
MYECVLRDIHALPRTGDAGQLRRFLIAAVVQGGATFGEAEAKELYGRRLGSLLNNIDHCLISDCDDFLASLNQSHPDALPSQWKARAERVH